MDAGAHRDAVGGKVRLGKAVLGCRAGLRGLPGFWAEKPLLPEQALDAACMTSGP